MQEIVKYYRKIIQFLLSSLSLFLLQHYQTVLYCIYLHYFLAYWTISFMKSEIYHVFFSFLPSSNVSVESDSKQFTFFLALLGNN